MGDSTAKTPIPHKNPNKNTHLKHMEKMGVKNNIPVENLLDEFLKQSLAPNANDGNDWQNHFS